jgi:hypothetical protein
MSLHTVSPVALAYNDIVVGSHWAANLVHRLTANAILVGNNNKARPQDQLTRAEFAKMLVLAKKLEATATTGRFSDIRAADWHNVYVAAAVADGFITGNPDGTFAPSKAITRQEMAAMLYKAMGEDAPAADFAALSATFDATDLAKVGPWAKAAVASVNEAGLMTGKPGPNYDDLLGTGLVFDPLGNATRAEAAAVVTRLIDWMLTQ